MPYYITKTNGDPITIEDKIVDYTQMDIGLVGRNYVGYGDDIALNFIRILENFANSDAPINPTAGQLWFNTSTKALNVHVGTGFQDVNKEALDKIAALSSRITALENP